MGWAGVGELLRRLLGVKGLVVQKLASEAVDSVRRQEAGLLSGTPEGKALKKSRWALLKNPWNLTQRQGEKLSDEARTNKRLYRAYLLKESLAHGLDYRQKGRAERHLDGWAQWASFGFHSAQVLMAMIHLCCGGLSLAPPLPISPGSRKRKYDSRACDRAQDVWGNSLCHFLAPYSAPVRCRASAVSHFPRCL